MISSLSHSLTLSLSLCSSFFVPKKSSWLVTCFQFTKISPFKLVIEAKKRQFGKEKIRGGKERTHQFRERFWNGDRKTLFFSLKLPLSLLADFHKNHIQLLPQLFTFIVHSLLIHFPIFSLLFSFHSSFLSLSLYPLPYFLSLPLYPLPYFLPHPFLSS